MTYLLLPVWPDLIRIPPKRWLLFLLPTSIIAGLAAWHFLSMPEIPHQIEIVPVTGNAAAHIQLQELRAAYGNSVPLSAFSDVGGWGLQQGLLVSNTANPVPIRYSFIGPIREQVRVTFLASPQGGQADVILDGQKVVVNLTGPDGDERRARLDTAYRWGFLNFLIVPIIFVADAFTILVLLASLWLMQEIRQSVAAEEAELRRERFLSHAQALLAVCSVALVLHGINFLTVPLTVLKDSPSYLQGAVYWIQHHSLDGVSSYRGPGTTFLFAPFMAPFGRDPLGLKLALHLLAIACVPLSYRIGWQLSRRRWFAFAAGLLTALIPDLYAYSSYILSEAPDVFVGLLFLTLLLSALDTLSFSSILAVLLVGSFSVLVRSENLAASLLGMAFLLVKLIWLRAGPQSAPRVRSIPLWQFGVTIVAAIVPLIAWSAHNQRVYGFFGLSDFAGAALYDGWIYFGENSHIPIADHTSPSVRAIDAVYDMAKSGREDVPTSWSVYGALVRQGYGSERAFSILQKATLDSIRSDPDRSWKLLLVKLRQGFEPHPYIPATFSLAGEHPALNTLNATYFDQEQIYIPSLIQLQRAINGVVARWYSGVFTAWSWLGAVLLFISLYRRPFFRWGTLAVIAVNSILLPTIIGMSMWRYVLLGMILLQYPLLSGVQSIAGFLAYYFIRSQGTGVLPKRTQAS